MRDVDLSETLATHHEEIFGKIVRITERGTESTMITYRDMREIYVLYIYRDILVEERAIYCWLIRDSVALWDGLSSS